MGSSHGFTARHPPAHFLKIKMIWIERKKKRKGIHHFRIRKIDGSAFRRVCSSSGVLASVSSAHFGGVQPPAVRSDVLFWTLSSTWHTQGARTHRDTHAHEIRSHLKKENQEGLWSPRVVKTFYFSRGGEFQT